MLKESIRSRRGVRASSSFSIQQSAFSLDVTNSGRFLGAWFLVLGWVFVLGAWCGIPGRRLAFRPPAVTGAATARSGTRTKDQAPSTNHPPRTKHQIPRTDTNQ